MTIREVIAELERRCDDYNAKATAVVGTDVELFALYIGHLIAYKNALFLLRQVERGKHQ